MEGAERGREMKWVELVFGKREAQSTRDAARSRIAYGWTADEKRLVASHRWDGLAVAGKQKGAPYVEGRGV